MEHETLLIRASLISRILAFCTTRVLGHAVLHQAKLPPIMGRIKMRSNGDTGRTQVGPLARLHLATKLAHRPILMRVEICGTFLQRKRKLPNVPASKRINGSIVIRAGTENSVGNQFQPTRGRAPAPATYLWIPLRCMHDKSIGKVPLVHPWPKEAYYI